MELSSTLQFEQMTLGDANELSSVPSPTSLSPDSSHAPTLASLPPELLSHIFDSIPTHPYYDRVASLSNLCLVNRYFLDLARPLLYHDIHLDLEMDFDWSRTRYNELYNTLTSSPVCLTGLMKHLRVSFRESFTGLIDMAVFGHILSHLNALESIRTSWWHEREDKEVSTAFIRAITRYQKGLKCLEIPRVSSVEYEAFKTIFTELPKLKTFVGDLVLPSKSEKHTSFESICKLRRLVVTSDFNYPMFTQILSFSQTSLTSLAFRFSTTNDPFDLSSFPNLVLLRIELYKEKQKVMFAPHSVVAAPSLIIDTLRKSFASLRTLPLKTFSISTRNALLEYVIKDFPLIDALPSSIDHLGTMVSLLERGTPNFAILRDIVRNRSNPHLKRISIFLQLGSNMQIDYYAHEDQQTVKNDIEEICQNSDIRVETMAERDDTLHGGLFLDPWQSDSETESESPSDEDEDDYRDD